MNNIATLVKMQLKEKLNLHNTKADLSSTMRFLVSALITVIKFALSSVVCWLLYEVSKIFMIFGTSSHVPDTFITFLFSILLLLSVLSCTIRLTKALYFSHDNVILLTLPSTPTQVFLSKLAVFFIFELKKNMSFLIPMFVGYFIAHGHSFVFYPWLIVTFILISVFTVAIGAFLSIPVALVANVFRQRKSLQYGLTTLVVFGVIFGLFYLVSVIPQDLDLREGWTTLGLEIKEFFDAFSYAVSPLYEFTRMIIGEAIHSDYTLLITLPFAGTMIRFGILVLVTAVFLALSVLVVNPLFYSMASKPFEFIKAQVKPKENRVHNPRFTAIHTEFLKSFKDSGRTMTNLGIAISTPILIFVLNLIFSAMPTTEFGDTLIIACNILIILLISLNSSSYAASIFSRDGRSAYLIKVQPKSPTPLLIAKLLPTSLFCIVSFLMTAATLISFSNFPAKDVIFMMLGIMFIYFAHLLYSAELDILNPHTEVYAAIGDHGNDPNELKSTSAAFIISFLIAAFIVLLILSDETISSVCIKLSGIGLLAFVYRAYLFFTNIKLYYKEK